MIPITSSTVFRRTCAAFVVGISRRHHHHHHHQSPHRSYYHYYLSASLSSCTNDGSRLFSTSTFQAPVPPQSKGQAVYPDMNLFLESSDIISSATKTSILSENRSLDPNAVFVVTGATRGIGLQFVKTLLAQTKGTVVACGRDPHASKGLQEVLNTLSDTGNDTNSNNNNERLHLIEMDLEQQDSIVAAAEAIRSRHSRVDMLLNVAGLLGDGGKTTIGPERSIAKMDREWLEKSFAVNVFGPVMFSKELAPLMAQKRRQSQRRNKGNGENDNNNSVSSSSPSTIERPNSIIANLSARVGSVSDNNLGGWYSYRMSKAALNQATRTMAHELKRQSIWCISLHPGTTDTDLSKPFQKNVAEGRLFPVDFTVESLLTVIDRMEDQHSGGLYDWAGKAIPF